MSVKQDEKYQPKFWPVDSHNPDWLHGSTVWPRKKSAHASLLYTISIAAVYNSPKQSILKCLVAANNPMWLPEKNGSIHRCLFIILERQEGFVYSSRPHLGDLATLIELGAAGDCINFTSANSFFFWLS